MGIAPINRRKIGSSDVMIAPIQKVELFSSQIFTEKERESSKHAATDDDDNVRYGASNVFKEVRSLSWPRKQNKQTSSGEFVILCIFWKWSVLLKLSR